MQGTKVTIMANGAGEVKVEVVVIQTGREEIDRFNPVTQHPLNRLSYPNQHFL